MRPRFHNPHPPFRLALGTTGLLALLTTAVALAATLAVSSAKLTTSTGSTSILPTTCTLTAADADSRVEENSPTNNFGTSSELHVRSRSGTQNKRSFITFSLSPCAIPANSLITSASLGLFLFDAPSASRTHEVHRVTASWTETGVTWSNQPSVVASATTNWATGTTNNVTLTANVTSDVQAFVDGTGTANNGWRINDQTEGSATDYQSRYRSAEEGTASQRPTLTVTYYP